MIVDWISSIFASISTGGVQIDVTVLLLSVITLIGTMMSVILPWKLAQMARAQARLEEKQDAADLATQEVHKLLNSALTAKDEGAKATQEASTAAALAQGQIIGEAAERKRGEETAATQAIARGRRANDIERAAEN